MLNEKASSSNRHQSCCAHYSNPIIIVVTKSLSCFVLPSYHITTAITKSAIHIAVFSSTHKQSTKATNPSNQIKSNQIKDQDDTHHELRRRRRRSLSTAVFLSPKHARPTRRLSQRHFELSRRSDRRRPQSQQQLRILSVRRRVSPRFLRVSRWNGGWQNCPLLRVSSLSRRRCLYDRRLSVSRLELCGTRAAQL